MLSLTGGDRGLKETFQDIAEDLMNLEVNTIIQTSLMTARKAPRPAHALLDIAWEYRETLLEYGYEPTPERAPGETTKYQQRSADEPGPKETPSVNGDTFRTLYAMARERIENMDSEDSASSGPAADPEIKQAVLSRIRKSSVEIANILDRVEARKKTSWAFGKTRRGILEYSIKHPDDRSPDLAITNREWIMIRKVWEISVEQIAMQTVIQLDGDVVTRICRTYAGDEHHHLWNAHMDSTKVAMNSWQYLVETVGKFLTSAASLLRGS